MKKSELYKLAILSVMHDNALDPEDKLEVVELLIDQKATAAWCEERDAKEQEAKNNG